MSLDQARSKQKRTVEALPLIMLQISTVPLSLGLLRGQPSYMRQRGIETTVVSSPGMKLQEFSEAEEVACIPIPMSREISPIADVVSLCRLVRVCMLERPTIVHAQTPKAGLLGMLAGWLTRRPVRVYSILGLRYMTTDGFRREVLKLSERVACSLASSVICVSDSMREIALADKLARPSKMIVLGHGSANGIDAAGQFNPERRPGAQRDSLREGIGVQNSTPVVGFVGRIVQDKGIEDLANAWKIVHGQQPSAQLFLIGPEEPHDPVSPAAITYLKSEPSVHFVGPVSSVALWYSMFDIVVLPSHREGLPNVLLEAASMEVPVVATAIPGCTDAVIDGVTGVLAPPRAAKVLASAIARYIDDPVLRNQHGRNGRERIVKNFRQELVWEAIYQEYCRLMKAKGISIPTPPFHASSTADVTTRPRTRRSLGDSRNPLRAMGIPTKRKSGAETVLCRKRGISE